MGNDDISDGIEHKLDVVGIGGTGGVSVNLLIVRFIPTLVLVLYVGYTLSE